jgi:hypothetical protein
MGRKATGSIRTLKGGRWQVRVWVPVEGKQVSLGTYGHEMEAQEALATYQMLDTYAVENGHEPVAYQGVVLDETHLVRVVGGLVPELRRSILRALERDPYI